MSKRGVSEGRGAECTEAAIGQEGMTEGGMGDHTIDDILTLPLDEQKIQAIKDDGPVKSQNCLST
jgi:hypothetical protein